MERSSAQKWLRILSIILIVFSILSILAGLLLFAGGSVVGASIIDTASDEDAMAVGLTLAGGLILLVSGIVDLIIGLFGLRGAKNPKKIGVFFVLAIIGVVVAALGLISTLTSGPLDAASIISGLISLALPGLGLYFASQIKKENNL
ncbi:MAG: hypothetical protein RR822_06375 [Raoultibacter sp.]